MRYKEEQTSESKTRKHIRRYMLRQSRIVHECQALNKSYSLKEWRKYIEINGWKNSDKVVASINGFDYNIFDMCLNPKIPVEWDDGKYNRFRVELCQLRDGRWNYGFSYWFIDGGKIHGACYPKDHNGFVSEKEAVYECLEIFVKELQRIRKETRMYNVEYDNNGDTIDTSSCRKAIADKIEKALKDFQVRFNPHQLSLFEL